MNETVARLEQAIRDIFLGPPAVVRLVLTGLFAEGHILLEDVPGVGKTLLARTVASCMRARFKRIQFTPDLLPSDLLGTSVFNPKTGEFEFRAGPVFANVVLADEINRTTPRTQAALLEAMNVGSVTLDGVTHRLPQPFLVLATQNPFEFEGTYALPESQLDRFLLRLDVGYPSREDEKRMLHDQQLHHPIDVLEPVLSADDVGRLQLRVRAVRVDDSLRDYLLAIVAATRRHPKIRAGISPRGSNALQRASQAHAFLEARDFVVPDDIKRLVLPVCAHRLILRDALPGDDAFREGERLLEEILESVEVPL